MREVVVVGAVRTPIGRRNGGLAGVHPADLLAAPLSELFRRVPVDPAAVDQVVGGCVGQVAEQTGNITRTAWLTAGLPIAAGAATLDSQCGSSQHATNVAAGLVASGAADVVVACGVESMSQVPMGASSWKGHRPTPRSYRDRYELTSQFEGAERIAEQWAVTRDDADEFGLLSQVRAAAAIEERRFEEQIVAVTAPEVDDEGNPTGSRTVAVDEGPRPTTPEGLAALKPVARPDGVHTAGTSSQISDGAGAVLLATAERAAELGVEPRARLVDHCLVGTDPVLMLTGPIDATRRLLSRNGLAFDDLGTVEINEAFASVVLAWQRELDVELERVNPNGGAIALGHPLGGTGVILLTKALHELEREQSRFGLVTMCCGGGLGTGTLLERL
jgi:acetyl-CoA C-acetyltransferase